MKMRHETYGMIFDTVYIGLMTNLLATIGCAPFLAVLLLTDPARTWPLLALLAPLCAPAVVGVFAILRTFSQDRAVTPVSTFARAWRSSLRRATTLGLLGSAVLVVLGVDIRWAAERAPFAAGILVALAALAVASGTLVVVVLSERPAARLRDALKACAYLAVRRWYLTLTTLAFLGIFELLLVFAPVVALGVATAPVAYLVWANCRYTLRPALDDEATQSTTVDGRQRPREGTPVRA